MNTCTHPEFKAGVVVNRLTSGQFIADLEIACASCSEPFRFRGMPAGVLENMPTVSASGLEARLPIEPKSALDARLAREEYRGAGRYVLDSRDPKELEAHDRLAAFDQDPEHLGEINDIPDYLVKPSIPGAYHLCSTCRDLARAMREQTATTAPGPGRSNRQGQDSAPEAPAAVLTASEATVAVVAIPEDQRSEPQPGEPAPATTATLLAPLPVLEGDEGDEGDDDASVGQLIQRDLPAGRRGRAK